MLSKIKQIWNNHGFEIILGLCVAFILVFALYNKFSGKNGSWTKSSQLNSWLKQSYQAPPSPPKSFSPRKQGGDSKGELECRRVLQYLFKKPFDKARPDFLRNPVTGGSFNLELDCFDAELRIAVEYNGVQHYKYVPYFHRNNDAFLNQKYRDEMKRQKCKENGVLLIEVPYSVKLEDIKGFIEKELTRAGVKF
jgi:hypothetical protein